MRLSGSLQKKAEVPISPKHLRLERQAIMNTTPSRPWKSRKNKHLAAKTPGMSREVSLLCTSGAASIQSCGFPVADEDAGFVGKDNLHFVTRSICHDAHAKALVVDHIVILK